MISAYYGKLPQREGWDNELEQSQLELGLEEIKFAYYMDPIGSMGPVYLPTFSLFSC